MVHRPGCESYRHVQVSGVFEAAVAVFLAPLESEAVTVIHAGCTIQRTPHPRELLVDGGPHATSFNTFHHCID